MIHISVFPCLLILLLLLAHSFKCITSPPYIVRHPPHELWYQISSPNREDRPVILECEAKGDPVPEYRWTKNGQEFSISESEDRIIQEVGKGTLIIHRPVHTDEGFYQCRAENHYGTSFSNVLYLRRAGFEMGSSEMTVEEITVDEGQPLTIRCFPPTGTPRPNVFWIIQSPNGAMHTVNGTRVSFDPEGDLHFSNVTMADASTDKHYVCSAFSPFLRQYQTGNLTKLIVRPSASAEPNKVAPMCQYKSPKNLTEMRGQSIDIYCIYGGTPLPEIRWERKGAPMPVSRTSLSDYGKVLRIINLQFEDQGTYECSATNGVGQVGTQTFTLTVESEPYWIVAPETALKAEYEDHTFTCMAGGVPEPRIQWFVNGIPVENLAPSSHRQISGNNITLTNIQKYRDTGNYQCNASNTHGYIFADVYMNVLALPAKIIERPAEVSEQVEGARVTIKCRAYGYPHPNVRWEKDGHRIIAQAESKDSRYEVLNKGDLVINLATFMDTGNYTCFASNRFGQEEASGRLEIKSK